MGGYLGAKRSGQVGVGPGIRPLSLTHVLLLCLHPS
jgi:hypothetical protein